MAEDLLVAAGKKGIDVVGTVVVVVVVVLATLAVLGGTVVDLLGLI